MRARGASAGRAVDSETTFKVYMRDGVGGCELNREDASLTYGWVLNLLAALLLFRVATIALVTFATGTGRLCYILPFNLQERRSEQRQLNGDPAGISTIEALRANPHPEKPVVANDRVLEGAVPAVGCCETIAFDRYWSNILGAFRAHENYGLLLYAFGVLALGAALHGTVGNEMSYVPSSASSACGLQVHPDRPCTFVDLSCSSIYAPVRQIESTLQTDGTYALTISPHTMLLSQLSCSKLSLSPADENSTATGCYFYDTCCTPHLDVSSSESVFDRRGEQVGGMRGFAAWSMLAALLYFCSTVAYAVSIVWFNVAPIAQVTLNRADRPACCFEWSLYGSIARR